MVGVCKWRFTLTFKTITGKLGVVTLLKIWVLKKGQGWMPESYHCAVLPLMKVKGVSWAKGNMVDICVQKVKVAKLR